MRMNKTTHLHSFTYTDHFEQIIEPCLLIIVYSTSAFPAGLLWLDSRGSSNPLNLYLL